MNTLLKLRPWLTVPEATQHLSTVVGEPVSEADLLRLALDGHLTLSVNFVNKARGRCGRLVPLDEAEVRKVPDRSKLSINRRPAEEPPPVLMVVSQEVYDNQFLKLDEEISVIDGVWDLPLLSGERLDIEHAYQMLTGGPSVELVCLEGTLVRRPNGEFCSLYERRDLGDNEIVEIPAPGLPDDCVRVIRTDALLDLQQRITSASDKPQAKHRWPWGDYDTELLRHLAAAADKWWVRYDPADETTAPDKQTVVAWLEARGVSNRTAQSIDTILRADERKRGGPSKRQE